MRANGQSFDCWFDIDYHLTIRLQCLVVIFKQRSQKFFRVGVSMDITKARYYGKNDKVKCSSHDESGDRNVGNRHALSAFYDAQVLQAGCNISSS